MAEYRIDPQASEVRVSARSSLHPIEGRAADMRGRVSVDLIDGRLAGSLGGRLEVPVDQLRSGNPLYDAELRRRVDARRYPVIVGEVRTASAIGDNRLFKVEGDVTFHGVTRPTSGELTVSVENDRVVLEGTHVFDVRDFGIKPPRILTLRVHPDVRVTIRLVAVATAGSALPCS